MKINYNEEIKIADSFEKFLEERDDSIKPVHNSFLDIHEEKIVDNETYWSNKNIDYFEVNPDITPL